MKCVRCCENKAQFFCENCYQSNKSLKQEFINTAKHQLIALQIVNNKEKSTDSLFIQENVQMMQKLKKEQMKRTLTQLKLKLENEKRNSCLIQAKIEQNMNYQKKQKLMLEALKSSKHCIFQKNIKKQEQLAELSSKLHQLTSQNLSTFSILLETVLQKLKNSPLPELFSLNQIIENQQVYLEVVCHNLIIDKEKINQNKIVEAFKRITQILGILSNVKAYWLPYRIALSGKEWLIENQNLYLMPQRSTDPWTLNIKFINFFLADLHYIYSKHRKGQILHKYFQNALKINISAPIPWNLYFLRMMSPDLSSLKPSQPQAILSIHHNEDIFLYDDDAEEIQELDDEEQEVLLTADLIEDETQIPDILQKISSWQQLTEQDGKSDEHKIEQLDQ